MSAGAIALIVVALFVLITAMAGVRIGGEVWSARAFFEGQVLEPGARAEVAKIEGATALVYE